MKPARHFLSLAGVTLLGVIASPNERTPDAHLLSRGSADETARETARALLKMTDAAAQQRPARVLARSRAEDREGARAPYGRMAPRTADAELAAPAENPLWKLPQLTELSSTRERPIFSPTRRPPPTPAHVAPVTVRPPVKPSELQRPALSLVGTVIGTDLHIGVFLQTATKNVVSLRIGEDHEGWVLRLIEAGEVTLVKHEQVAVLMLPPPGEAPDALPRVATGIIPIVSNESYVDEQPLAARAPRRR